MACELDLRKPRANVSWAGDKNYRGAWKRCNGKVSALTACFTLPLYTANQIDPKIESWLFQFTWLSPGNKTRHKSRFAV